MKTIKKFQLLFAFFFATIYFAQQENSKLAECESLTIQLFKGNTQAGEELTKCLVSLAYEGSEAIKIYNRFTENIASQSQEALQEQLNDLENKRAQAKQFREQTQSAMINNISQNIITQAQNYSNSANSPQKTQQNSSSKCVNRPGYGCSQQ